VSLGNEVGSGIRGDRSEGGPSIELAGQTIHSDFAFFTLALDEYSCTRFEFGYADMIVLNEVKAIFFSLLKQFLETKVFFSFFQIQTNLR